MPKKKIVENKEVAVQEEKREIFAFEDTSWFQKLVDTARTAMDEYVTAKTELSFQLKWHEIEAKHKIGELLDKHKDKAGNFDDLVRLTGLKLGLARTVVYECVQAYRAYPKLTDIPEGKAIGWTRLMKVYVQGGADPKGCEHKDSRTVKVKICNDCGYRKFLED